MITICCQQLIFLKGAQSNFINFLKNFWRFWYHKKADIFLITHVRFCSWKWFCLKGINENMPGYGNRNWAYTVRYRQVQYTKLLHTSERLDLFNWNVEFTSLEWWFFKWNKKTKFWKLGLCTFKDWHHTGHPYSKYVWLNLANFYEWQGREGKVTQKMYFLRFCCKPIKVFYSKQAEPSKFSTNEGKWWFTSRNKWKCM